MADSNPFPVLPQYQGDYYDAQRKMMLAQALQAQAMQPMTEDQQGWNQMRVVPRASPLSGIAKIGQALLASKFMGNAIDAQRALGQKQWEGMQSMFQPQSQTSYQATSQDQSGQPTYPPMESASSPRSVQGPPQPSPMNPAGLPPQLAAMQYFRDPNAYMKEFVAPSYAPTEATRIARAANVDPTQANMAALTKANYIAPTEARPGGWTLVPDGRGGFTRIYNPNIPQGGVPITDAQGNVIGAGSLPGATNVEQQMAAAKAAGSAQYQIQTGVDANGMPVYRTTAQIAGDLGNSPQASNNFPGYQAPGSGGFFPGLPAGSEALIKGNVERHQAIMQAAANAPADINAFRQIDQAASQAKTGVAFDRSAALKSWASVIPGIDPNASDKVNSDIINKYSQQIAGRNGGRSDAALETALHSITNSGMSPQAIHELTPSLIGLRMADLGNANARQQWLQSHGNAPASLQSYEQQWNKSYDPDVYRLQAMNPQQQKQFVQSLPQQRAHALLQSRQALRQLGAIPDMGQ